MRARLSGIALLCAVTAALALDAPAAAAGQQGPVDDLTVTWQGKGEIQLTRDGHRDLSLSLRLDGNVEVRAKRYHATAERLVYNTAVRAVSLEAGDSGEVRLSFQMPNDGPTLRLAARKIVISLADGSIKLDGAGTLSTPGKKPAPPDE